MKDLEYTMKTMELAEKIGDILHGNDPSIQGAVLGHLTAMWLAGHQSIDGEEGEEITQAREMILNQWLLMVRKLIPTMVSALSEESEDGGISGLPN